MEQAEPQIPSEVYFIADAAKSTLALIEKDENDQFELELLEKIKLSHDTYKFVFKLPSED